MSHNYPYGRPVTDTDLRPDRRHASPDHHFYRPPQESFSSTTYSSSSSSSSRAQCTQDGALSILSSCGLEPSDLALLAELPEDVLTVESLPHVLKQIKGKRGTVKPFPSNTPSPSSSSSSSSVYPHSSAQRSAVDPSSADWDQLHSQSLLYPTDQVTASLHPTHVDRWGSPRTRGAPQSSSSSSSYHRPGPSEYGKTGRDAGPVSSQDYSHRPGPSEYGKTGRDVGPVSSQDYSHRPGPSEYGKTGRDAGPVSSQDFFSLAGGDRRTRRSPFCQPGPADYLSAPAPEVYHPKTRVGRHQPETETLRGSSQPVASLPSKKEAMDFHGTRPMVFPYSCSLCAITVMSERVWIKHINGTHHADGQLNLLQRFPTWDCRLETVSRADNQSESQTSEGPPEQQHQAPNQNPNAQSDKKAQKKASEKSKVVCVRFPANSVDEAYLRKLTEPFGKIVKILMFPSLAFVELGSIDQAKDLVKFHVNYPPTVNGAQMEFRISNTFSFLQSSRVVSFTPAPLGENGQSDLLSIIKRFGPPLYTLFLPSMAFVEMKNTPDAQKLVDYYSSNTLRINDDLIKVSFSGEYKSLMRVTSAKRYAEETDSTKRTRSSSREMENKMTESKKRRRSTEEEEEGKKFCAERKPRTRSRSREKSTKERSTSRSRDKSSRDRTTRTRSRSREKSAKEKRTRTRSRSRRKSGEKSSREKRSRSRDVFGRDKRTRTRSESRERRSGSESGEKSSRERRSGSESISRGKSAVPEKSELADSESRTEADPAPVRDSKPEAEEKEQTEEETESSAEESDIEGMEVIGEDGENLDADDMETLDDAEKDEEEEEEDNMEETAEKTDSPEEDKEREVTDGEADNQQQLEDKKMEEEEEEEEEKVETEKPINEKEREEEEKEKPVEEEETPETQQVDDEEFPDFPVDLENCITLDELEEDQSDDDKEVRSESKSPSRRVIYFRNLPLRLNSDADFIRLVRGFGTAVQYYLKPPSCGFIEMSTSTEAQRAVKGLISKPVTLFGSKVFVQMSNKYRRLHNGWPVPLDEDSDEEKRSECRSRSNRRSERQSREESNRKPEGRKELSKKTQEKESSLKESTSEKTRQKKGPVSKSVSKSPEKQSSKNVSEKTSSTAPGNKLAIKETLEKETTPRKTVRRGSVMKTHLDKDLAFKKTAEQESHDTKEKSSTAAEKGLASKQTVEKEDSSEKVCAAETTPEKETYKRKETREDNSVPEKKKEESSSDENHTKQELETTEAPEEKKMEDTFETGLKDSQSPDQPHSTDDTLEPQTEQKPAADLHESKNQVEQQTGPAGGAAELQNPTKPVGTEFVRPVVGYFCNLCQVIYVDEDEAKLQHCRTLTHYRKYQEKTGKDPWTS